jgi:transcription-repair coupling factor
VERNFLEKLFKDKSIGYEFGNFTLVNNKDVDISRLYSRYLSIHKDARIILLPENFINSTLKSFEIRIGENIKISDLISKLTEFGYTRLEQVYDLMQYSQKGDVLIIYSNINNYVYKLEFFGDKVEKISLLDNVSMRLIQPLNNLILLNFNPKELEFAVEVTGSQDNIENNIVIHSPNIDKILPSLSEANLNKIELKKLPLFHKNEKVFHRFIENYGDYSYFYSGKNWELIPEGFKILQSKDRFSHVEKLSLGIELDKGFIYPDGKVFLFTDREVLSTLNLKKSKSKISSKFKKLFENEVNIGDYVVHEAHGIGIYKGIETKVVLGEVRDYAIIEYLENDKLLIPLDQIDRLSKYISSEGVQPKLTRLGTAEWDNIKRRLKKSVEDIAKDLIELYAKKAMLKGNKFKEDTMNQLSFEANFPYPLTEDQIKTLNEVKEDMESTKPMDRLIIGDVGFGKTEIALRAAFKAIQSGMQVIVLAPTTVLATQLYEVFYKRLYKYGIKISRVTRFDGAEKNKENIKKANNGKLDVLIGTHRLLSKDISLPKLGLLIIDEEQRFGVKQKERMRTLRHNIDVLAMSATPIPRTLQMALTGIKDISIIATPPAERLPVKTEVIFKEEISEKIEQEISRGGQVFVIHNRIESLDEFVARLKSRLSPEIRIAVGHGQMSSNRLEKIMFDFEEKTYDVLIATTIIENGIDIPAVNTIVIDDSHTFGLSQLYQLRGRVGRSDKQSYCYLVLPKIKDFINLHNDPGKRVKDLRKILEENKIEDRWVTPESVSRVEAILENQELGAGFKIASRDLEIRGSGNILGAEQSGYINSVGYEMFVRLLEQEIDKIRKEAKNVSKKYQH